MELKSLFALAILICVVLGDVNLNKKSVKLAPCDVCRKFVESFKKGMERTSRGNFAGGDAAWEEEKLGSYYQSEVRLVEIEEKLCLDVQESEAQCHSFVEEAESDIETWWFKKQNSDPDLEKWLCISTMNLCCEPGHYGPKCIECAGYPDAICSGNGKCEGDGTRYGNGQCNCNRGYAGEMCDTCAVNYFDISEENEKTLCSPCHVSCLSGCSDDTSKGCEACKIGWEMKDSVGCVDVDECKTSKGICKDTEICVNEEGSYSCKDMKHHGTKDPGKWVRYITYVSFLIATGIFFRKSVLLGCFIGLMAALYVSMSEIVMNDQLDLLKLNLRSWFPSS